jgi:hypothetical protein
MTDAEFQTYLAYLDTRRNVVWIEVEIRHNNKARFDTRYNSYTGLPVHTNSDTFPYYVWSPNADPNDKWGIEMRLYFTSDGNLPTALETLSRK